MSKEKISEKIKIFSSRHPFNLIDFKGKLPRIPLLINEYKSKIKNDILTLNYGKGLTDRNQKEINKNFLFNTIIKTSTFNHKKKRNSPLSASPKKKISRNKKTNKKIKLPSEANLNLKSDIFLTNVENSKNEDYLNNKINNNNNNYNTINISSISNSKKFLPPIIKRKEFIKSLDFLMMNTNLHYENFQNKIENINHYEEKMIKKCNKYFKKLDDKITIKSDEFLKEKFIDDKKNSSLKFNDYFDKLITKRKEFDYLTMINLMGKYNKKKKLRDIVNKQKNEKKHKKFYKVIEDTELEAEKVNKLIDSLMNKSL